MNTEERMLEKRAKTYGNSNFKSCQYPLYPERLTDIDPLISAYKAGFEACADICKEQEKNTAVAFAEFTSNWQPLISGEWEDLDKTVKYTTEQLFTIFKDNQNGTSTL